MSTRPPTSGTPSRRRRASCEEPIGADPSTLTTRCQGTCSSVVARIRPTRRGAFRSTSPYVRTKPAGMARTRARIRAARSVGSRSTGGCRTGGCPTGGRWAGARWAGACEGRSLRTAQVCPRPARQSGFATAELTPLKGAASCAGRGKLRFIVGFIDEFIDGPPSMRPGRDVDVGPADRRRRPARSP